MSSTTEIREQQTVREIQSARAKEERARRRKLKAHKASERARERRRIIRWPQLLEIMPYGETEIRDRLIATGRLRPVPLGERAVGFVEDEVYEIVEEIIAARDEKIAADRAAEATA